MRSANLNCPRECGGWLGGIASLAHLRREGLRLVEFLWFWLVAVCVEGGRR